jgi:hypothetical protein
MSENSCVRLGFSFTYDINSDEALLVFRDEFYANAFYVWWANNGYQQFTEWLGTEDGISILDE